MKVSFFVVREKWHETSTATTTRSAQAHFSRKASKSKTYSLFNHRRRLSSSSVAFLPPLFPNRHDRLGRTRPRPSQQLRALREMAVGLLALAAVALYIFGERTYLHVSRTGRRVYWALTAAAGAAALAEAAARIDIAWLVLSAVRERK